MGEPLAFAFKKKKVGCNSVCWKVQNGAVFIYMSVNRHVLFSTLLLGFICL